MKKFLQNNFTVIVLVIAVLGFFKSCGDSRDIKSIKKEIEAINCLLYTSPSPRDRQKSRMPSSA